MVFRFPGLRAVGDDKKGDDEYANRSVASWNDFSGKVRADLRCCVGLVISTCMPLTL